MLKLTNISKTFNAGTVDEKKALKNLNLTLEDGDFVTVIGSNGAGKSTLFNMIGGTFLTDEGTIELDGEDITFVKEYVRSKKIGRLFQDPTLGTAPSLSIEDNLGLAYSRGTKFPLSIAVNKKDREFFKNELKRLDLGLEDRLTTSVGLLSGGQRQALALLMATMVTPKLLLLDEHTAALDPATVIKVMKITDEIVRENKITTLMITHDIEMALTYGNKTIVMNDGQIIAVLEGEERKNMKLEDVLKLYSSYSITMSDVSLLKQQ